ncbi:MAG TPA: signal peptide peptidase SppA [Prosthecochloris aestuarii]|uniref:Signal peptide peptidase SppA n=1 Tax=Prosthecochloris aestuarii TaxID=1102 RepID=A0A831SPD0_PROAE|nr:signal peptide peptidase SppA [Prosthecochloris aestuarii]
MYQCTVKMKKTEPRKLRITPFRAGCLIMILFVVVSVIGLFRLVQSARALPDSFVLVLNVAGQLPEIPDSPVPASGFFGQEPVAGLQEMLFAMEHAAADERVKEVMVEIRSAEVSPAVVQQLHRAISHVQDAGKPVTAFLRGGAEDADLWIASACDSVIVEQGSTLLLDGLKAELLFYTGVFEKIGVSFQAAQWKEWKSGVEPFVRKGASRESRAQLESILDDVYRTYLDDMTVKRELVDGEYEKLVNSEPLMNAERAFELGLCDRVEGYWEYISSISGRYSENNGLTAAEVLVDAGRYVRSEGLYGTSPDSPGIGVLTVEGGISGSGNTPSDGLGSGITEDRFRVALDAALENDNVRAIVLRINSPGGDALASANMRRMLDSARTRKPVVVSMSGVAASGGYMMALASDSVFAEPLTLTGSIGVYALKPVIGDLGKAVGLEREVIARGAYADAYTVFKPLDDESFSRFMEAAGWVYDDFILQVSRSRGLLPEEVDRLAGGRVWTGRMALEHGLVDSTGGLFDAVRAAAMLAGMETGVLPPVERYPAPKHMLELLFEGGIGTSVSIVLSEVADRFFYAQGLLDHRAGFMSDVGPGGVQVRADMPYMIRIR